MELTDTSRSHLGRRIGGYTAHKVRTTAVSLICCSRWVTHLTHGVAPHDKTLRGVGDDRRPTPRFSMILGHFFRVSGTTPDSHSDQSCPFFWSKLLRD